MSKWPTYSSACISDVGKALLSGCVSDYRSNKQWGVGPKEDTDTYRFERELEKAWGVRHCVAMNSGTMALTAAIKALELPPGSEIITTPLSFSATPASIVLAGHVPVFADVSWYDFTLDPESVRKVLTRKTKAILPVDLFGALANYKDLSAFGLPIIQDNAQAAGAVQNGKHLQGVIACGSANGAKNVPGVEAGWAYTNDRKLADRMRDYISHGENFGSKEVGCNGRMHKLAAILCRHGLAALDERNWKRIALSKELFYDAPSDLIKGSYHGFSGQHVYYVWPFKVHSNRDRFIKRMKKRGITVGAGYIRPTLDCYKAFARYYRKDLSVAHELSSQTLCLLYDMHSEQPMSYPKRIAEAMRESLR